MTITGIETGCLVNATLLYSLLAFVSSDNSSGLEQIATFLLLQLFVLSLVQLKFRVQRYRNFPSFSLSHFSNFLRFMLDGFNLETHELVVETRRVS